MTRPDPQEVPMSLTLHYHPLASFCMKVLVGLYELELPFTKKLVNLGDAADRAEFAKIWPMAKFPLLSDSARGLDLPETSIILEYLDSRFAPGRLIPADPERALECRLRDRFFDLYVNVPMGKIVTDKLRPEGKADPHGVDGARAELATAYDVADRWLREGTWAVGDAFTMADCAAAPSLFYANKVVPFGEERRHLAAYFARLAERPSFRRVVEEAEPYFAMFPG
jgi:glutathione S-transferase